MLDNVFEPAAEQAVEHADMPRTSRSDKISSSGNPLVYPSPIDSERIDFLISRGIMPEIAAIDLEMVKMKLAEEDEGLGWCQMQCDKGELAYKRFLHLCKAYGKEIVPTRAMDQFWHYHILDTRSYIAMCDEVFGGYLHHYPYFGMRGEDDAKDLKASFMQTKERYQATFGESLGTVGGNDCWNDCENRCWHACSNK